MNLKIKPIVLEKIPGLIYRKGPKIISSKIKRANGDYADLNISGPDFEDYFKYVKNTALKKDALLVGNARGCRWNKCLFCFLNIWQNYRAKNNSKIVSEIAEISEKYRKI